MQYLNINNLMIWFFIVLCFVCDATISYDTNS